MKRRRGKTLHTAEGYRNGRNKSIRGQYLAKADFHLLLLQLLFCFLLPLASVFVLSLASLPSFLIPQFLRCLSLLSLGVISSGQTHGPPPHILAFHLPLPLLLPPASTPHVSLLSHLTGRLRLGCRPRRRSRCSRNSPRARRIRTSCFSSCR